MRTQVLAAIAASISASSAFAASPMDLSIIDRAVADFTGAEIGQSGGARLPVDRRLRLSNCQSPLDLKWYGRDQGSVQVSCPTAGWRIYVAVDGGASRVGPVGRIENAASEPIIKRGESVSILVRGKGFTLTRQGSAVEDGAIGQWIKIKAVGDKSKTLRAIVLRPGRVGIELP